MSPHNNNAPKAFWFVDTRMFRGQNILTGTFRLENKTNSKACLRYLRPSEILVFSC